MIEVKCEGSGEFLRGCCEQVKEGMDEMKGGVAGGSARLQARRWGR